MNPERLWAYVGGDGRGHWMPVAANPHPGMCCEDEYVRIDIYNEIYAENERLVRNAQTEAIEAGIINAKYANTFIKFFFI